MKIVDRFIKYVSFDTKSDENSSSFPSTSSQIAFGNLLVEELKEMGVDNAYQDEYGYIYCHLDGNKNKETIGLIAHMDTSPSLDGGNYIPRIIKDYDGKDIKLCDNVILSPSKFSSLNNHIHHDLIVTDGHHLLGGDDKAGITIIMEVLSYLLNNPSIDHAPLAICFTPDEEIGQGASHFDVKKMKANIAYTIDGGAYNEINYENFNAASFQITFKGVGVHPGFAKNIMINAIKLGMEFNSMLPFNEAPEYSENYEGFYHLTDFKGDVEVTKLSYILRDHDIDKLNNRLKIMENAIKFLKEKYPYCNIEYDYKYNYKNMKLYFDKDNHAIEVIKDAFKKTFIEPIFTPIRGGTDGATITYMGLPCPNIGTGDYNCHGRYEYVSINEMKAMIEIIKNMLIC